MIRNFLSLALGTALIAGPLSAQQAPTISERLANAQNPFEQGTYQALGAIETLLQSTTEEQIGRGFIDLLSFRGASYQILNLEQESETFITIVETFAADLENARTTLALTDPQTANPFVMDLKTVWFDINQNGQMDADEGAIEVLQGLAFDRSALSKQGGPIEVRFDGADHAWLVAYTHALSAMAEGVLAFDPTPVFQDLQMARADLRNMPEIPNLYVKEEVEAEITRLKQLLKDQKANTKAIRAKRSPLEKERVELRKKINAAEDATEKETLRAKEQELNLKLSAPEYNYYTSSRAERSILRQIDANRRKLPAESLSEADLAMRGPGMLDGADAIYSVFETLRQQPDPKHIAKLDGHLRAMLENNRIFWTALELETDNDREWVPNSRQTNAFGLEVPEETADTWQSILADAEAVLDGKLLIAHPLVQHDAGISLRAWLDDPSPLDPVGWIHGRDAYPYLARGPHVTEDNWLALQRLTGGNGFGFSLFLN